MIKQTAFKIIKEFEAQGWDLVELNDHSGTYYAKLRKDKVGIYIEVGTEDSTLSCLDLVCPECGKSKYKQNIVDEECSDCEKEWDYKRDIMGELYA